MAFYEAVRVKALERIHQLETSENHTKRFSILAEITRLRQACCHASLVDENMLIESSKIKTFITLVKNIIDNKHKALIFSQFVRYLDKIKEVLNQENIDYQYLDGSTSIKDRQRAVNDFQALKQEGQALT
jgi:SNF2 family DNA or RNA helicase